ncbi:MAG: acetate uptake transporter [Sporomusa sp.]
MSTTNTQTVKVVTADPSGLGLFGLAMVTLVASSQKLGLTTGFAFLVPWAIFLGAIAQMIACVNDFKHNNVFGATAFGAYGLFWLSVAASWLIKLGAFGPELAANVDGKQLGVAFIGYLIFSIYMTIGAIETNKMLLTIFVLIDFLFIGLAADTFGLGHGWHTMAAWAEFLIALVGFYGGAAATLNAHFGKQFLPLGKPFGIFK